MWGLVILCACFGATFACQRAAERGRFAAPYSTHGAGPQGAHGLFQLTRRLGFDARVLSTEVARLPAHGTLVAIGGCAGNFARELGRPEREALETWVKAGGLLIVAGAEDYVPVEVGLDLTAIANCDDRKEALLPADESFLLEDEEDTTNLRMPIVLEGVPSGPPLSYLDAFAFDEPRLVMSMDDEQTTELVASELGMLAATTPYGRGRVVLMGTAVPLTNAHLAEGGGLMFARLLRAFAGEGPVLFDEFHLGMGERRSIVGYLRERGLGFDLLQLASCIVIGLLAYGARLGPALRHTPAPARNTQRFLSALGALFYRTRDVHGALEVLSRHGLMRIAAQYRAQGVALDELESWLAAQGLAAVATYAARVREHAQRPLHPGETLVERARQMERDVDAAVVIGVT
jgi:hypothetical protein